MNVKSLPLLFLLISNALFAQSPDVNRYELIGDRPHANGDATVVNVSFYLLDIDTVDDANKRFSIDFFLNVSWQDPRLAVEEDRRTGRIRTIPLDEIWSPRGLIVNDRGLSPQLPMVADVDEQGGVQYRQRLAGDLAVDMNLREFPFDTQRLPVEIISYQYSPQEVRFTAPPAITLEGRTLSADGWNYTMLEPEVGDFTISSIGVVRPQVMFVVEAQRDGFYYLMTMLLPISLILFMSWTAFWLQPDIIPTRIGISTASIFSLIAFGVSIRLSLPPISYLTRTDIFMVGAMFMVFLALAVAVIGSRWANSDRLEKASRLNGIARWAYVVLFAVIVAAAFS